MSDPIPSPRPSIDVVLITQSVISIILVLAFCLLLIGGSPIPELLTGIMMLVLGFYFGQRSSASVMRQTAQAYEAASFAAHVR